MNDMNKEEKATALKYNSDMEVPLILYNGRGRFVQSMLEIARKKDIPIVYEPETQEILSLCKNGDFVPFETWEILVKVFSFIGGQLESVSKN